MPWISRDGVDGLLTLEDLQKKLAAMDGRGYKSYAAVEGIYRARRFVLYIDHVQADPFAPPTRCRVRVAQKEAGFAPDLYADAPRRTALEDFLNRRFLQRLRSPLAMQRPGQEILERTAVLVTPDFVEARFTVSLPARGRTVQGREAAALLGRVLVEVVEGSLFEASVDRDALRTWVETAQDQAVLRERLAGLGLVAFVGDGSVLPRESGVSDRPAKGAVVPFTAPPELAVEIKVPNRGVVRGMGIPRGVTLIVGGGYHGKSTLLKALERGVYNHIPGDGREIVVTVPGAVKIRAEDGRNVTRVNISSFIGDLPGGVNTAAFSTPAASGSTSQAANIAEALEMGADVLLMDEDTCATNFMIRDHNMRRLVPDAAEPITPFIDRVRDLWTQAGVSTVLVTGGAGEYFGAADRVIMMHNYVPADVTARARDIAEPVPASGRPVKITARSPLPRAFVLDEEDKVRARGTDIRYGRTGIELGAVEQLVDPCQTAAVAEIMRYAGRKYVDGNRTLKEVIGAVIDDLDRYGLDVVSRFRGRHPGELARPRPFEIAAAINRWPGLLVR